jgi:hypothetical protein
MSLLAAIRKLWHSIAPRTHSDVEEEVRSTLEAYQEDLIRHGLPEEEARRKARIDLGRPAQRTTEFGVRLALGAPRAHVLWVAARIALVSAAAGIVLGLTLDSFLGAVLAHWMQNAFAAGSLFAAAGLLALCALLTCLLPARHAIAVPPAEALRNE